MAIPSHPSPPSCRHDDTTNQRESRSTWYWRTPRSTAQFTHEVLLVRYATHPTAQLLDALHWAAARGVAITLLLERASDNPAYAAGPGPSPTWMRPAGPGPPTTALPVPPCTPR
jgi:hypothetical protein